MRPCFVEHPEPVVSGCHPCKLYRTRMDYRLFWGGSSSPPTIGSPRVVRVDNSKLSPGAADARFNASLIRFQGRLLLAYRTGWAGACCHIAELTDDGHYTPINTNVLAMLRSPQSPFGCEDPRLFVFRGQLHIAYIGVMTGWGPTNQLYARLNDQLEVEEVFAPEYLHRQSWEKNWGFFEWQGELMAVYMTGPKHVVLHVNGNKAYPFAETDNTFPWSGGVLRGGAPPVLVGDRYYHWFHGRIGEWAAGRYSVGLSVFEAKPPFRVVAQSPHPLWMASHDNQPADQRAAGEPAVVFPAGAFLENGKWIVSSGCHDRWIEIHEWDAVEIERILSPEVSAPVLLPVSRGECIHLGVRTEFRAGCGGRMCRHDCLAGEPDAVPGGVCQSCEKWAATD